MSTSSDKARALRLERLRSNLDHQLAQPDSALETLMTELQLGDQQTDLWERLHAAAVRDSREAELAKAYERIVQDRRLRAFAPPDRATVLLHAVNYFQGVVGDAAATERFLWRILQVVPDHADAFERLEKKLSTAREKVKLVELYALVAVQPPKPLDVIARATQQVISVLPSTPLVPDDVCWKLLVLLPANPSLLRALEAYCRKTGRFTLACDLLEASLEKDACSDMSIVERRQRLVEMYLGDAKAPEKAISHLEALLAEDPENDKLLAAGDRLLRVPPVASRAAAALQAARRLRRERGL